MSLSNERLMDLYEKMLLVREFEEKHHQLLKEGKMQLMAHTGLGQEAVAVGITGPLLKEDILFGTHRGVGEYLGKGMSQEDIWAEFMGKRSGLGKGKGTLHLSDRKVNIPPLVASLGSDFGMAIGTALASRLLKKDQVTLYFVGEGTCNQGDFNPSLCMASLWSLPVVFVICTNQFCQRSYMDGHFPTKDVAPRAEGYAIPFEILDGQDVEAVYEETEKAVKYARKGKGPFVLEFKTFRMGPHSSGDRLGYVKKEDLEMWGKRDPIELCRRKLMDRNALTEQGDREIRDKIEKNVEKASKQALMAPDPTVEDLFEDVYSERGLY